MGRCHTEKRLLDAWRALAESDTLEDGWRTIPIFSDKRHLLRVGLHFPDKMEGILVGFQMEAHSNKMVLPKGKGFAVIQVGKLTELPNFWIGLHRQPTGNLAMFVKMVVDVLNVLNECSGSQNKDAFEVFLYRIKAWQKFMENRQGELSFEEKIGLCGELEVLKDLLVADVPPMLAVAAWKGPLGELHDFSFNNGALEVKATASEQGNIIRISSAEQLDLTLINPLYLMTCHFLSRPSGSSLQERMKSVRTLLCHSPHAVSQYESLLMHRGIENIDSFESEEIFLLMKKQLFLISEDFPKLSRSTLSNAISEVQYSLNLSLIEQQHITLPDALLAMGVVLYGTH